VTELLPQLPGVPVPEPSPLSAPFWNATREHYLIYQRCEACAAALFEPAQLCQRCGSIALMWVKSLGIGTLYSWSCVWRPHSPAFRVPYAPAIVELSEGFRMLSAVIGCEHDQLHVGMPLRVEFHKISNEVTLPYFAPRGSESG
jgi:hypothetical protein